jgi:hypothetical protein
MTQTRKLTENTPGACANYDATKVVRCCYQEGYWVAQGACAQHQIGKQKYTQTVAGNCPLGTDTKYEDCETPKLVKVFPTTAGGRKGVPVYKKVIAQKL